jgi:hypothetical protein
VALVGETDSLMLVISGPACEQHSNAVALATTSDAPTPGQPALQSAAARNPKYAVGAIDDVALAEASRAQAAREHGDQPPRESDSPDADAQGALAVVFVSFGCPPIRCPVVTLSKCQAAAAAHRASDLHNNASQLGIQSIVSLLEIPSTSTGGVGLASAAAKPKGCKAARLAFRFRPGPRGSPKTGH